MDHPNGADVLGGLFVGENQVDFVGITQLEDGFGEKGLFRVISCVYFL